MQNYLILAPALLLMASPSLPDDVNGDGWMDTFPIDKYTMVADGNNRYWSLKPGRYVVLGNLTPDGTEFVIISVLEDTETVDGIETRVIEERESRTVSLWKSRATLSRCRKRAKMYFISVKTSAITLTARSLATAGSGELGAKIR